MVTTIANYRQNESSQLLPVNPDGTRAIDRDWDMGKTWAQMEDILASGKVKAIGVCNWSIPYLEELKKVWRVKPSVNQVELHPYLPQHELRAWCRKEGILMEAYSPLGGSGESLPFSWFISLPANHQNYSFRALEMCYISVFYLSCIIPCSRTADMLSRSPDNHGFRDCYHGQEVRRGARQHLNILSR